MKKRPGVSGVKSMTGQCGECDGPQCRGDEKACRDADVSEQTERGKCPGFTLGCAQPRSQEGRERGGDAGGGGIDVDAAVGVEAGSELGQVCFQRLAESVIGNSAAIRSLSVGLGGHCWRAREKGVAGVRMLAGVTHKYGRGRTRDYVWL